MDSNLIILTVCGLTVSVCLVLLLRALFLWYWRINEVIDLLREIRDLLKKNHG
jgi:hypothetical protein